MNSAKEFTDHEWLLLDFDGPICSVFAGYPAPMIARQLVAIAAASGVRLAEDHTDPHEVLRVASAISSPAGHAVEVALQAAEIEAVNSATPTPGAKQLLEQCAATNRRVAIVSNNHGPAIEKYARRHALADYLSSVVGRDPSDVRLMKPSPYLLFTAMGAMRAYASQTAFIGDSESDITAGIAADVTTIGYANKPGKSELLSAAGADMVVESMQSLASLLTP